MPQDDTHPAREVFNAARERLCDEILRAALAAAPYSALRSAAAMGAARINPSAFSKVSDAEVAAARDLVRKINDLLEVAPTDARDGLRRTRLDLEELIDRQEEQRAQERRVEASRQQKANTAVRRRGIFSMEFRGGAGSAPDDVIEG